MLCIVHGWRTKVLGRKKEIECVTDGRKR
jgi:hypothetical protein